MRRNPEILRNIWLEMSLARLLAMPIALGLLFVIVGYNMSAKEPLASLGIPAGIVFFLLVKIWGGHKAAETVIDEVNGNTWDFQKLSALSPLNLAIGKMFGGTIFTWYGGLIALFVGILAESRKMTFWDLIINAAIILLSGLIVHAGALFSSLVAAQGRLGVHNRLRVLPHHLVGLLLAGYFTSMSFLSLWNYDLHHARLGDSHHISISWYGDFYNKPAMIALTAVLVFTWLFAGIYWQMRNQMKMRGGPWLWLAFVVFWVVYGSGFNVAEEHPDQPWPLSDLNGVTAFAISFLSLYVIAFQEDWSLVRYRRLVTAFRTRNWRAFFELCPRWILTLPICLLVAFVVSITYWRPEITTFLFALLCFAVRDIGLLHVFRLTPGSRRPTQSTFFYLLMLYGLLPFLFLVFRFYRGVAMFFPWPFAHDKTYVYQGLISAALQAVLVVILAAARWRRYGLKSD